MVHLERRVPFGRAVALLVSCGALLAFASTSAVQVERSNASCLGNSCMPVGSYTLDVSYNCGVISTENCWANGTTNINNAVFHHYGWGSASYSGAGSTAVGFKAETSSGIGRFGGWGTDLIRGCYYDSCVPQTAEDLRFRVYTSGAPHTIWGHAKA